MWKLFFSAHHLQIEYYQIHIPSVNQDIEASVNLRHVTNGNLRISRRKYDPQSGQITFSLELGDPGWTPRLGRAGRKKWDEETRTFTEVGLLNLIVFNFVFCVFVGFFLVLCEIC